MKKVLLFLMLFAAMLPAWLQAQTIVEIGTGTSTTYVTPFNSLWGYSVVEQIYADNEINTAGTITAISFYFDGTASQTNNIEVYMKNVTRSSFSSSTDYEPLSASDLVYSGSWAIPATAGWTTITLDNPFFYDGSSNLLVALHEFTSGYSTLYFAYTSTTDAVLSYHSDSDNPDPANLGSYTGNKYTSSNRANIQLEISTTPITCPAPSNLTASNVTNESAFLSWSRGATESSWDIYMTTTQTDVPDSNTTPTDVAIDTTYDLTNLNSQTTYYFYVRANCGGGDVSRWKSVNFTTLQVLATLPYTCDFEDPTINSEWALVNGTETNKWCIGTAVNNTDNGSNALYISNDNGTSNAYDISSSSYVYAYRDIEFDQNAAAFQIDFDWRNLGENSSSYDYLKVYLGDPAPVTAGNSSIPAAAHATLLGTYYGKSTWQHASFALSSSFAGSKRLYFYWYNDTSVGDNPPAAVDNLSIVALTCGFPTNLALDSTTSTTATFHWHPATPNDNAWEVAVAPYGTSVDSVTFVSANDTTYTAQGLNPDARYVVFVRTDCGGDASSAISINFRTECADYVAVPYMEDFDGYGSSSFPSCWTRIISYSTYPYTSSSAAYGGSSYGLYFYNTTYSSGTYSYAVAPAIDPSETLADLSVRFNMKRTSSSVDAILGIMTNPTDTATFTPIQTIQLTTDWQEFLVPLTNVTATNGHLAIKTVLNNSGTYGYVYMDNFEVIYTPNCLKPTNFVSTGNTQTTVSLAWHEDGSATSWNVAYGPQGFNPNASDADVEPAYDTVITINNLTSGTIYDFYVQSNCGSEVSEWRGPLSSAPGQYVMQTSGWDTLYTCGAVIYDDGGANGNYSNYCEAYLVIYPDQPGSFVEISGTLIAESSTYDYLIIYDGVGTANQILKTNQTSSSTVYQIPSTVSTTGPLTIYFRTDSSGEYAGFELTTSCVSCVSPSMTVQTVGMDNVTLSWGSYTGTQTNFEVAYGPAGVNPDSVVAESVSNVTSLQLTGLNSNTAYDAYIRTQCDDGNYSNWSAVTHFFTLAGLPAEVPYTCDFEDADENSAWMFANGTQTNKWYIGNAVNNTTGGDSALYISNNNGVSNAYTNTSLTYVWAYRDIYFTPASEYTLSFDWRAQGESSNYDYLTVYIAPAGTTVTGGNSSITGATVLFDVLNLDTAWTTVTFPMDATYSGTTKRLFFRWYNDSSGGSNPPAAVDNIVITGSDCGRPMNVHAENVSNTSADIVWSAASSSDAQWEIEYGQTGFAHGSGTTVSASNTVNPLSNLTPATRYDVYVRTDCGNNEYSEWSIVYTFLTECDAISTLPYTEQFENVTQVGSSSTAPSGYPNHEMPLCWSFLNMSTNTNSYPQAFVSNYSSYAVSGNCLFLKSSSTTPLYAILPTFTEDVHNLQVTFKYRNESTGSSNGNLSIGYMTDPLDASTFVELYACPQITTITEVTQVMSSIPNDVTDAKIAFKYAGGTSNNYYASIDNVVVEVIPTCPKPTDLTVEGTTSSSVTLAWTENGSATSWEIEYGTQGFTQGQGTTVTATTNPFTINNLTAGTAYDFYVRATCSAADLSTWSEVATAVPGAYSIPTSGEHTVSMCGGVIYDDGGVNGNYSSDCDVTVVVNPDTAGLMVRLTGTFNVEEDYDLLTIYDGVGTTGTVLFDSDIDATLDVVSTTGPLTIHFESDVSVTYSGFEIQVSCEGGTTPPEPCNAPANVAVSNVTTSAATVDWTQEGTPDGWVISYKKGSANTWTTINTSTHPYTITNLEAETSYSVFVTAVCGEEESTPSNTASFTTEPDGVNVYANSTIVYPNPTTGKFRIENSELSIENVEVYDVYGKLITTVKVEDNNVELDLSGNASGVYFTRIFTDKGMITKRIVKK